MAERSRSIYAGLALGVLFATAARALLSTAFYLSLATLRLNESAFWTLALLAPLAVPFLRPSRWPVAVAGVAVAALPFLRFTSAFVPVAALAVAAGALALAWSGPLVRAGVLAGMVLDGALLLLGASHDPLLAPWGAPVALALAFLALAHAPARPAEPASLRAGVAWGALVAVALAFLAAPYTLARHLGLPPPSLAAAGLAGATAGFLLLRRRSTTLVVALGLVALLDVAYLRSPLALLSLGALHAALAASAWRLAPPHGWAFGLVLGGALFGLLFFGQPLGGLEWTLAVPALCVLALLGARPWRGSARAPWTPLAAALVVGLLLVPLAPSPKEPAPPVGDELRVVDWNVHQGFGNRGALDPALYADALRRMRPDVLVLQEADTARLSSGGLDVVAYLSRELGLRPVTSGSSVAILSRFPPAAGETPSVQDWTARAALDVGGRVVHVQGVHLARSPAERALQVEEILRVANATQGPLVLAGDLNSCPVGACFGGRPNDGVHAALATAYQDAWTVRHEPDDPAGNTHPSHSPRRRIDVVMVRDLEVVDAGPVRDGLTRLGSDHLPVLARLRLPPTAP